jgi:hypothetical protein
MIKFTIIDALHKLIPSVEWNIIDNDLSTLEIFTPQITMPTQKQIDEAIKDLENEHKLAQEQKATEKAALLAKLGISESEAALLLG